MHVQEFETAYTVQEEEEQFSHMSEGESLPFQYAITSYGADFDVEGLVERIETGEIYLPPFQQGHGWTIQQASKFIESLLLNLPVPGIFLSRDTKTQKLLVIDGQQRLRTLSYFLKGIFEPTNTPFALQLDHQSSFDGLTYNDLRAYDRRRLNDAIIHATIIRQIEPDAGDSSIYLFFERINMGVNQLQPQEIRFALYHGPFNDLLAELNNNAEWRLLVGKKSQRRRDEELILRFLALYYHGNQYTYPMKGFLNTFMGQHKTLSLDIAQQFRESFESTVSILASCIGVKAFHPTNTLNAAVLDSVMVGICHRLKQGKITDCLMLQQRYDTLLSNEAYLDFIQQGTGDTERLKQRIAMAIDAFKDVV